MQLALSAGRYIVIFTELIVILSFAARFTLDRQITDLNAKIFQSSAIIESYGSLEKEFRSVVTRVENIKRIEDDANILDVFQNITTVTPLDVTLTQLSIAPSSVSLSGRALSQASFNLLINNLQASNKFFNISVDKVESGEAGSKGLVFGISADTREVKKESAGPVKASTKVNILDRTEGL